jgi:hypothetical protein
MVATAKVTVMTEWKIPKKTDRINNRINCTKEIKLNISEKCQIMQ